MGYKFRKYLFLSALLVFFGTVKASSSSKVRKCFSITALLRGGDRPMCFKLPVGVSTISSINMPRSVRVNLKRANNDQERRVELVSNQSVGLNFDINVFGCLTGILATEDPKQGLLDFSFDVYDDVENLWVHGPSNVTVDNIKKNGIFCLRRFGPSTVKVENLEAGQLYVGSWGPGSIYVGEGEVDQLSLGVYGGGIFNAPGLVSGQANVWVRGDEGESKWVVRGNGEPSQPKGKRGSVVLGNVEEKVRIVVDENGREASYQGPVLNGLSIGGVSIAGKR